eukprot:TRINITY_DN34868_c0_g1_i1.p1 TRINITY_DN34868_c0_g1~~TRINITY_DN34868_c0_g1_i1.p1  ORF type:complete len:1031 (-),score=410.70 TRINITY_DN34868_c0_g1_i1:50-3142(-)
MTAAGQRQQKRRPLLLPPPAPLWLLAALLALGARGSEALRVDDDPDVAAFAGDPVGSSELGALLDDEDSAVQSEDSGEAHRTRPKNRRHAARRHERQAGHHATPKKAPAASANLAAARLAGQAAADEETASSSEAAEASAEAHSKRVAAEAAVKEAKAAQKYDDSQESSVDGLEKLRVARDAAEDPLGDKKKASQDRHVAETEERVARSDFERYDAETKEAAARGKGARKLKLAQAAKRREMIYKGRKEAAEERMREADAEKDRADAEVEAISRHVEDQEEKEEAKKKETAELAKDARNKVAEEKQKVTEQSGTELHDAFLALSKARADVDVARKAEHDEYDIYAKLERESAEKGLAARAKIAEAQVEKLSAGKELSADRAMTNQENAAKRAERESAPKRKQEENELRKAAEATKAGKERLLKAEASYLAAKHTTMERERLRDLQISMDGWKDVREAQAELAAASEAYRDYDVKAKTAEIMVRKGEEAEERAKAEVEAAQTASTNARAELEEPHDITDHDRVGLLQQKAAIREHAAAMQALSAAQESERNTSATMVNAATDKVKFEASASQAEKTLGEVKQRIQEANERALKMDAQTFRAAAEAMLHTYRQIVKVRAELPEKLNSKVEAQVKVDQEAAAEEVDKRAVEHARLRERAAIDAKNSLELARAGTAERKALQKQAAVRLHKRKAEMRAEDEAWAQRSAEEELTKLTEERRLQQKTMTQVQQSRATERARARNEAIKQAACAEGAAKRQAKELDAMKACQSETNARAEAVAKEAEEKEEELANRAEVSLGAKDPGQEAAKAKEKVAEGQAQNAEAEASAGCRRKDSLRKAEESAKKRASTDAAEVVSERRLLFQETSSDASEMGTLLDSLEQVARQSKEKAKEASHAATDARAKGVAAVAKWSTFEQAAKGSLEAAAKDYEQAIARRDGKAVQTARDGEVKRSAEVAAAAGRRAEAEARNQGALEASRMADNFYLQSSEELAAFLAQKGAQETKEASATDRMKEAAPPCGEAAARSKQTAEKTGS